MYHSPVPLIIIRPGVHSLIEVNGQLLGECLPGAHLAMPAGDTGDYFITATPLSPQSPGWPVTRKLSLERGAALPPQAGDVSLCAWPGGVYELTLPGPSRPAPACCGFPRELDQLSYAAGQSLRELSLYYEDGLKLSCREEGAPGLCLSLGEGEHGSLALYTGAGRQFIAVSITGPGLCRLIMLNTDMESALELSAGELSLCPDGVYAIDSLGTALGHQRRTLYRCTAGGFAPQEPEVGFFTRKYAFPSTPGLLAAAFCEAVREGLESEAMSYLAPNLREGFSFQEIREFLGEFQDCRPPLSHDGGRLMGLIVMEQNRLSSARLVEFEFDGGLISEISEA